jgi:hypothetical protein
MGAFSVSWGDNLKAYDSLFRLYKEQPPTSIFAHFYPVRNGSIPDFDGPFKALAHATIDGYDSWTFQQERFQQKHSYSAVPKLRNYLNYTFVRLVALENQTPSAVVAAIQAYSKINAAGQWIERTEQVSLNDLFDRMSTNELEAYAQSGTLPNWFQSAVPIGTAENSRSE